MSLCEEEQIKNLLVASEVSGTMIRSVLAVIKCEPKTDDYDLAIDKAQAFMNGLCQNHGIRLHHTVWMEILGLTARIIYHPREGEA